jgi:hypothetical protein
MVNQVVNTGAYAGTRSDAGTALLDVSLIHELMDNVKVTVGDIYDWKKMICAPEAAKAFIDSRETDRRFISVTDNKRGVPSFYYVHYKDALELVPDEFVKKSRVFILPEGKGDQGKVVQYWGTDFSSVAGLGMNDWHLKPSSGGGYVNMMQHFMRAYGTFLSQHNAAIATLTNFTL